MKKMVHVTISCSLYLTILSSCLSGAEGTSLYFCKNAFLGGRWRFMLCEFFPLMWYIWWKINCIRLNKCVFSSGSDMWILIIKCLKYLWWTSNLNLLAELEFMVSQPAWNPLCKERMETVNKTQKQFGREFTDLSSCLHQSLWSKMCVCPNKVERNASENIATFLWVNAVFQ